MRYFIELVGKIKNSLRGTAEQILKKLESTQQLRKSINVDGKYLTVNRQQKKHIFYDDNACEKRNFVVIFSFISYISYVWIFEKFSMDSLRFQRSLL